MLPNTTTPVVSAPRIENERQVLRQQIRIAGTALLLTYRSDRVPGRRTESTVRIPLTGKRVPKRVKKIALELEVAGVRQTEMLPAVPDQLYEFTWKGNDGPQRLNVRIGYVERPFYPRPELIRWHERVFAIGADDARPVGLGGWVLSPLCTFNSLRSRLYTGDGRRRKATALTSGEELHVSAAGEVFIFDRSGRHLRTVDARSGALLVRHDYDAAGRLVAIEQSDGSVTRIERDEEQNGVVILTPSGRRTVLTLAADGYLASITGPAGHLIRCAYGEGGLLRELTDANGSVARFSYDRDGRIIRRDDPEGAFTSYAFNRSDTGSSVAVISALGREMIEQRDRLPDGERRRLVTCCGGRVTETRVTADGSRTVRRPDGSVVRVRPHGDALLTETVSPAGLTRRIVRRQSRDQHRVTEQIEVNGRVITVTHDLDRREEMVLLGERVERVLRFDAQGRIIESRTAGRHPVSYLYDDPNHAVIVRFGVEPDVRAATLQCDADGRVRELIDPLGRRFQSQYDEAGSLVAQILADGSLVRFECDPAGTRVALSPPGRPPYRFRRNARNLITASSMPALDGRPSETAYAYDAEGRLVRVQRPDGTVIESRYDAAGQLVELAEPRGVFRFTSDPRTGQRVALASPDGTAVSYSYDGFLLTGIRWEGAVRGQVERQHDDEFRIRAFAVNGQAIEREYAEDGSSRRVGELHIRRDEAGRVAETVLGQVRTRQTFNGFGEVESFAASFGDRELYAFALRRDKLGRVVARDERMAGEQQRLEFEYDARRRLTAIARDGRLFARYEYDDNGNRVASGGGRRATFDAGDRIVRDGDAEYRHGLNGERVLVTDAAGTTRYSYDAFGNLLSVVLPDGRTIDYRLDGDGRRLASRIDGAFKQGFLYRDLITPIAEVDANSSVIARFVFGERMNTPDYIIKDGSLWRVLTDPLGSPRLIVNVTTGAIGQRIDYDPFGVVERDTRPGFQPFGFAGGIPDPDTKLVHFGAREYDPRTARWTTPDPARFGGRDTNLYAYVSSDPVNLLDPFGLFGIFPGEGPNWHHTRNGYNLCPPTAPDQQNWDCPDQQGPPQLPPGWSYEGRPPTHGGHYRGFRHEAGYQCMYDQAGDLVTDPTMEGTYDYSPPYNPDGTVNPGGVAGHVIWDVIPWILWGN